MMRISVPAIAVVILSVTPESWAGAKPTPVDPDWKCSIALRDFPGDTIASDGGGAYHHGTDGVECRIVRGRETHYNWLYVQIASTSSRSMLFAGQSNGTASYLSFTNKAVGTFEVKALADVTWTGTPYTDVRPFRGIVASPQFAKGHGEFNGHSNFPGGTNVPDGAPYVGSSSVFVQALSACSWRITSYTTEDTALIPLASGERAGTVTSPTRVMRLTEGSSPKITVRGDFPMPFGATVTIIGNMVGCPQ